MSRFKSLGTVILLLYAAPLLADQPSSSPSEPRGPGGGDMTFCQLFGLNQFGREGSLVGLAVATTSWNIGTADLQWFGSPAAEHPFIAMNLYRLKDDRFEQIGQSWVKHGFFALGDTQCGGDCTFEAGHGIGSWLGMGCTDTYSAPLNATQNGLGPRYEVNPWTGAWSFAGSHFATGAPAHDQISHRLQVHDDDLDPAMNDGSSYFVEGYYAILDDIDVMNSAAWKPVTITGTPGGIWNLDMTDFSVQPTIGFAIDAWIGASQAMYAQELPPVEFVSPDGRCILAGKATTLPNHFWRYEYALLNVDMDRQVGSFSVPVASTVVVRNVGFHAVAHHDEPINAPGGVPIDNSDWTAVVTGTDITWSTTTNPLRWGTLYNFRFEINVPPVVDSQITIGHFKPGLPVDLTQATLGPSPDHPDCNGNMTPDFQEIIGDPGLDCDDNTILDECDPDCDGVLPPDACVIADCPMGDLSCDDCNANLIPDICDIANGPSADCNANGIPDECDVPDCNANGIPDACDVDELDPDGNGEVSADCNSNGTPDECEVPPIGAGPDCNVNGIPDICDTDCDADLMPDDCELPACDGILTGDMDCSGGVDVGDMPEFIEYLLSGTPSCRADLNHDLLVDGRDVRCFVDVVVFSTPCP